MLYFFSLKKIELMKIPEMMMNNEKYPNGAQ